MGRHRSARNRGLPEHVYVNVSRGRTYFRYRHPTTGKYHSLGTDKREAVQAARLLNSRLLSAPSAERLAAKILAPSAPFDTYARDYLEKALPTRRNRRGKPLAEKTLEEYGRYLAQAINAWGGRGLETITRRDVAAHLEPMTANARNHARSVLHGLFAYAIADGRLETNPVEGTLKATIIVQRQRLTKAQFDAIRTHAEPWLQHAMDLALLTLQRREDLVTLTAADVFEDGLHVRQKKTGVNLRIKLWPGLKTLLSKKGPLITRNGKPVTKDYLSRAFAKARDKVPALAKIPPAERPSLHELRALGARLMEEAGRDPQLMLGHIEAKTTRLYLDRHEERWIETE